LGYRNKPIVFFGGQITVETLPVSTVYIQEQNKAAKSETCTNMDNKKKYNVHVVAVFAVLSHALEYEL
jgi:hypothetical protein